MERRLNLRHKIFIFAYLAVIIVPVVFLVEYWPLSNFGVFTKRDHPDNLEIFTLTYNGGLELKCSPGRLQNISDRLATMNKTGKMSWDGLKDFFPIKTKKVKVWRHKWREKGWTKEMVYQWEN